jgi:mannose-6-phosphate isomerase-like protein (cupin superfamily)
MTRASRMVSILSVAILGQPFLPSSIAAQEPSCKMCPGTYIPNEEVQAYIDRAKQFNIIDQQVRAVDVGKSNLALGLVYRGKLEKPADMSVAEHDLVSELYHIIEGTGTLVLSPELVGAKRRPPESETVRMLNGPGQNAASVTNGVTYNLKPGDVVIIPAGTGHWFTKIDDHIVYLMVRLDPDKVTPPKTEADSKKYLATPPAGRR